MRFAILVALSTISSLAATTLPIGQDTVVSGPNGCVTLLANRPLAPGERIIRIGVPRSEVGVTCVYHRGKRYSPWGMDYPVRSPKPSNPAARTIHI